jgi:hypothetical protein
LVVNLQAAAAEVALEVAAAKIDGFLESSWKANEITPAPRSGDAEFHRRAWLDLSGVAPTVAATRQFLADQSEDKRKRLIDQLLNSPQHADHMATLWNEILLPPDSQTQLEQRENVASLHRWLREQFYKNVPYDHLVGSFLTAGGAADSGPAIFYTSHAVQPEKLAAATSRIFLGLQLQCAECHDHPFDRWTQRDFWQFTAFFAQLERDQSRGAQNPIIEDRPGREVTLPETETVISPRYPGVPNPPEPDPRGIRRRQLTIWLASRDNPYFARAAANRVWGHLFGRGLVEPVDAMDADNKPSHPELLEFLADHLIQLRFDLRRFYATLARTDAYGRSSAVGASERPPRDSFAAMSVKTLTAEQFYNSLLQNVYCQSRSDSGMGQSNFDPQRESFLARMRAAGSSPVDYPHGVVQALGMMNGPEVLAACSSERTGLLAALQAPFFDDDQRIETIFLATVSRYPSTEESSRASAMLASTSDPSDQAERLSDLLWALLNSAEFAMCP